MSDPSLSEDGDEENNWDDWNDENAGDAEPARSLFCDNILNSPVEAMQYDAEHYGFDLRQYAIQERLDEYDIFRCINFVRAQVRAGVDPLPLLAHSSSSWRGNDDYLKPVLEDDAMLFYDYEAVVLTWQSEPQTEAVASTAADTSRSALVALAAAKAEELQRLREENEGLREAFATLAASCIPDELREEAASARAAGQQPGSSTAAEAGPSSAPQESRGRAPVLSASATEVDGSYFDSYGGFGIHQEMISDKPRTDAYQKALEGNPSLVKGSKVLDVGCGTGILSLFACRAGASHVVSVEGNKRMAGFAHQICKLNGYSSEDGGPMTVLHGKVEELEGLPVDKVDVLVSEWMGYALLFETMLDSVLHARDRFLRPGGAMLPDIASIYIAGASSRATGTPFWKDVYGFDMSPIGEEVRKGDIGVANVHVVKPDDIVTQSVQIKELDLCTMHADDQDFTSVFELVAQPAAGPTAASSTEAHPSQQECHAIVLWFDTDFSSRHCKDAAVRLSTSCSAPSTHWAQTVMLLKEPVMLEVPGQVQEQGAPPCAKSLTGRISMVRNKFKHRFLDISLEYKAVLNDGKIVHHTTMYSMSVSTSS